MSTYYCDTIKPVELCTLDVGDYFVKSDHVLDDGHTLAEGSTVYRLLSQPSVRDRLHDPYMRYSVTEGDDPALQLHWKGAIVHRVVPYTTEVAVQGIPTATEMAVALTRAVQYAPGVFFVTMAPRGAGKSVAKALELADTHFSENPKPPDGTALLRYWQYATRRTMLRVLPTWMACYFETDESIVRMAGAWANSKTPRGRSEAPWFPPRKDPYIPFDSEPKPIEAWGLTGGVLADAALSNNTISHEDTR